MMISRINGSPAASVRAKTQAPVIQHVSSARVGRRSTTARGDARRNVIVQAVPPAAAVTHAPVSAEVQRDLNAR